MVALLALAAFVVAQLGDGGTTSSTRASSMPPKHVVKKKSDKQAPAARGDEVVQLAEAKASPRRKDR